MSTKNALHGQERFGLYIDLQPGRAAVGRGKSLELCPLPPGSAGDITRVRRQQRFLSALAGELKKEITPERFLQLFVSAGSTCRRITPGEIFVLYYLFTRLDLGKDLTFATLPGEFYESYWRLHGRELERLLEPFANTGTGADSKK